MPLTRDQLAQVVHATIARIENYDPIAVDLLHVQPWERLDGWQREYCGRIGEAVAKAVADEDRCPKCGGPLAEVPGCYLTKDGGSFPGLVCRPCKALWPWGRGYGAFVERTIKLAGAVRVPEPREA